MPFTMLATAKHIVARANVLAQSVQKRARVAPPTALLTEIDLPKRIVLESVPSTATLTLAIYKVTDCAGDFLPEYREAQAQLFEVMMDHPACPSLMHNLKSQFDEFLKHAHHICLHGGDVPTSLDDMDSLAGVRFV